MKPQDCALGLEVRDTITGYRGVVVAKTEWLNHCWRIMVQTRELKDGKPIDSVAFDVEQLEAVPDAARVRIDKEIETGGDRPDAGARPATPSRQ